MEMNMAILKFIKNIINYIFFQFFRYSYLFHFITKELDKI